MKILIAEDDVVSRRVLELSLRRWNYDVVQASSGTEAWEILQDDDAPSIAILDWMMPGLTGPELCRRVRMANREPYVYLLLLTARNEREDIIMGLEAGADDYITKPFDSHELEVRLRAGKRIVDLQTELMAARERLRVQATRDALTGIWNRSEIFRIFEQEHNRTWRDATPLTVALLDIDHFKPVNDTYGHQVGDLVLKEVAERLRRTMRRYDAIGRYGGEEFLAVLPGCSRIDGITLAERLRNSVSAEPLHVQGLELPLTISIGVTTRPGSGTASTKEMIAVADAALYLAKSEGRNRTQFCPLSEPVTIPEEELHRL